MDPEGSLPRSHGPTNCSYPAPAETSLLSLILFLLTSNKYCIITSRLFQKEFKQQNKIASVSRSVCCPHY